MSKQVIMSREKISRSKEYLYIDPETMEPIKEIWENCDCEPFWNEYYRVGIFDDEEYEYEDEALNEDSEFFYDFKKAKEYYDKLQRQLDEEEAIKRRAMEEGL